MKTTLITNIYNEEYLLPLWLEHHKKMFDHGIIIDYRSTDNSVEICKEICPTWEVRISKNEEFGCNENDHQFMEIEKTISGIKMILNTTEFLYIDKPLTEFFDEKIPKAFGVKSYGVYSNTESDVINMQELEKCVLMKNVVFFEEYTRGHRQIHTFPSGNYGLGRHSSYNDWSKTDSMAILWLGYYPWNQKMIDRKMQIRKNIPKTDIDNGYSYHHFWDINKLLSVKEYCYNNGKPIKDVCPNLQKMIEKNINSI